MSGRDARRARARNEARRRHNATRAKLNAQWKNVQKTIVSGFFAPISLVGSPVTAEPGSPQAAIWAALTAGEAPPLRLTEDMLARADAYVRAAADPRPYFEIITQEELAQMRDEAERNTNAAIAQRRNLIR